MNPKLTKDRRFFEIVLIVLALGMTCMLHKLEAYKMVALNFFYLPIVLSGYYLGRTSVGVLALFSVLSVTIAVLLDPTGFTTYNSPVLVGLLLTIWGAVLGLTAILVGTLCDERAKLVEELHEAYVGVVEVLSRYLQSADPNVRARSTRIAELSEVTASTLRLSRKETDDVRVGALLYDLGHVEITTQVINRAVNTLETMPETSSKHTFRGTDLVHSLGSVLSSAVPLLANQDEAVRECMGLQAEAARNAVPLGARIIRAVRAFDALTTDQSGGPALTPSQALDELRKDTSVGYDAAVIDALEHAVERSRPQPTLEPAFSY